MIAFQVLFPTFSSCSIWSTRITKFRKSIPVKSLV
jgi:hypothetical protein